MKIPRILDIYTKLTREIEIVRTILWEDVCAHIEVMKEQPDEQAAIRALVGAGFAHIEGVLNSVRKFCYFMSLQQKRNLTPEEFGHLNKPMNVPISTYVYKNLILKEDLLYSLRLISKIFQSSHEINEQDTGWECLKKAITVRNNIIHPK